MILEEVKDTMIDSFEDISYTYSGRYFYPLAYRSEEDIDQSEPFFIMVSFIPTSRKIGMSLNNFMGKRTNPNYSNYGYGEYDKVIVRVFCESFSGFDGRNVAQKWMLDIESYIKNNWNSLINSGSIDMYSFGHNTINNLFTDRQYGYELSFDVITTNSWTDEPATGATLPYEVSGIFVESGIRLWVKY